MDSIFSFDPSDDPLPVELDLARRVLGIGFKNMLDEERNKQTELAASLEAERVEKARAQEAAAEYQRKLEEHEALLTQQRQTLQQQVDSDLAAFREREAQARAEAQHWRETVERATQEHRDALSGAYAQIAAERVARTASAPQLIAQPPISPESISLGPLRGGDGLLRRVVLKADGYDDVAIDIVRGVDNRMVELKLGASA